MRLVNETIDSNLNCNLFKLQRETYITKNWFWDLFDCFASYRSTLFGVYATKNWFWNRFECNDAYFEAYSTETDNETFIIQSYDQLTGMEQRMEPIGDNMHTMTLLYTLGACFKLEQGP